MASTHYCARCFTTFRDEAERCPNLACGRDRPRAGWGRLLEPGDLLDRHYLVERALAVGGAGITYLAREVDADAQPVGPELAIKVLYTARASGTWLRRLANEAQILQELDHEHIVKCHGFVQRAGHEPYLVTLFEHGGSLSDHVERHGTLPARAAAVILRQILLALDVAHQRGVVHRDLKPDNVLLDAPTSRDDVPHVRVADFGIAKVDGGVTSQLTRLGAFLGTPEYAAPEQFRSETPTPATDVFAAGAVLFYMLTGRPPVSFSERADVTSSLAELVDALPPRLPADHALDPREAEVVEEVFAHTMTLEPEGRWTVHQLIARLSSLLGGPVGSHRTLDLTADLAPDRRRAPAFRAEPAPDAPTAPEPSAPPEPTPPPVVEAPPSGPVGPPPTSPRQVPPTSELEPGGKGGRVGLVAGLGAAGVLVAGVGGVLAVGALVATAWFTGWFDPAPRPVVELEPIRVEAPVVEPPARALLGGTEADQRARRELVAALDALGADLGARCDAEGPAVGTIVVDAGGEVLEATLDAGYLRSGACVAEALVGRKLPNPTRKRARARVAFVVGS